MPYAKNHIRVKVPHRSGFDKSHRNSGTANCGTLVPILCDEVIPNSRVSLRVPINAQMPPLASNTYMNVKLKLEAFFVPMRLLCGSFESWFTDFPRKLLVYNVSSGAQATGALSVDVKGALPVAVLKNNGVDDFPYNTFGAGSLADYLGCKFDTIETSDQGLYPELSLMPFLAYHKIWEDYYRNPRVQQQAFAYSSGNLDRAMSPMRIATIPYSFLHDQYVPAGGGTVHQNYSLELAKSADLNDFLLADGTSLFALRQRNFGLDYFTGARLTPQQGDASSVSFNVSGDVISEQGDVAGTGSFTIAALRAANSLQQFRERNNLPSPRLQDQVSARYGANLADGVAQRPICIGTATYDMQSTGVNQTAGGDGASTGNPFSSVAAQYGRASVSGNDFLINDFTANEPGYIMVLMSQVPEVSYTYGIDKMFKRYSRPATLVNMANPLLQNVGDEPIMVTELTNVFASPDDDRIFGYSDRFAGFMFKPNQIHGEFLQGAANSSLSGTLPSFVLQRALRGYNHQLATAFLQIPTNYMDGILAVDADVAECTYWYDCILDYKVSMPLAEFSIPSLQDPAYEHGETVNLRRNGQIF